MCVRVNLFGRCHRQKRGSRQTRERERERERERDQGQNLLGRRQERQRETKMKRVQSRLALSSASCHASWNVKYYNLITTPLPRTGCNTRSVLKRNEADVNLSFSFLSNCRTKAKELSLSCCLPKARYHRGVRERVSEWEGLQSSFPTTITVMSQTFPFFIRMSL